MARDKVCVVIGAGDATGGAIARRFAREGYTAVRDAAQRRQAEAPGGRDHPGRAARSIAFGSDARDEEQVIELFREIEPRSATIEVFVFNIGGNVRFDIRDTTARVYRKVWEMAAFAGFLMGARGRPRRWCRAAAAPCCSPAPRRACAAARLLGLRRRQARAARAGAEHGARARAAGHPRRPRRDRRRHRHRIDQEPTSPSATRRGPDGILDPDDIAEVYWQLHQQKRSAWTPRWISGRGRRRGDVGERRSVAGGVVAAPTPAPTAVPTRAPGRTPIGVRRADDRRPSRRRCRRR